MSRMTIQRAFFKRHSEQTGWLPGYLEPHLLWIDRMAGKFSLWQKRGERYDIHAALMQGHKDPLSASSSFRKWTPDHWGSGRIYKGPLPASSKSLQMPLSQLVSEPWLRAIDMFFNSNKIEGN